VRRGRLAGRLRVVPRALCRLATRRRRPNPPQRILVAHHLLAGDVLMLAPLLAKLRAQYPHAAIVLCTRRAVTPLFSGKPYAVQAVPYDPQDPSPLDALLGGAFDLALVPGANRSSWLAAAAGARWIVAFAGDRPVTKNWPIDALLPYPRTPGAWGDLVATLADGPPPRPYARADWPAPAAPSFERPPARYAVLHVGASSPLKQWLPQRWLALADALAARGIVPVWSAGAGEEAIVSACDPTRKYASYAGRLDLPQLWQLLAGARVLIAPDTGVAHLGRVVGVPTVALFGPGSALICGAGAFWRDMPYRAVTIDPFPCRDQTVLFKREVDWVRRCGRSVEQCPAHRCMPAIEVAMVQHAIDALLKEDG